MCLCRSNAIRAWTWYVPRVWIVCIYKRERPSTSPFWSTIGRTEVAALEAVGRPATQRYSVRTDLFQHPVVGLKLQEIVDDGANFMLIRQLRARTTSAWIAPRTSWFSSSISVSRASGAHAGPFPSLRLGQAGRAVRRRRRHHAEDDMLHLAAAYSRIDTDHVEVDLTVGVG
jgi:hypothetical protein